MLALKRQFLAKFRPLIEELPAAAQHRIWLAHHRELTRYFGGEGAFAREALDALDPVLQNLLLLEQRTSLALAPRNRDVVLGGGSQPPASRRRGPRLALVLLGAVVAGAAWALHRVDYTPTNSLLILMAAGLVATNIIVIDQVRRVGARTLRNVYAIQRTLAGERISKNTDTSSP
ncbi:MAG: hypothetical protein IPL79_12825 [Myxococcales bacterium]|nr:hypothetical protein [Myxococcales bacterium]